ncbi:MAG: hypothetical protein FJ088_01835 [Deltaproteobacteria bacterium]|nr:hypothetical protein [Deltaproteobacteria bacterium]
MQEPAFPVKGLKPDEADILPTMKDFTVNATLDISYFYKGEKRMGVVETTEISVAKNGDYELGVLREWEKAGEGSGGARRDAIWTGGKFFVRGRSAKFVLWEDAVMEQFEWRKERLEYLRALLATILPFSTIDETGSKIVFEGEEARLFTLSGKKQPGAEKSPDGFAAWFVKNYSPVSVEGKIIAGAETGAPLKGDISCAFRTIIGGREVEMQLKYSYAAKKSDAEIKITAPEEYLSGKRERTVKMIREILGEDAM